MTFIVTLRKYKGSDKLIKAYFKNVNLKKTREKKKKAIILKKRTGLMKNITAKFKQLMVLTNHVMVTSN